MHKTYLYVNVRNYVILSHIWFAAFRTGCIGQSHDIYLLRIYVARTKFITGGEITPFGVWYSVTSRTTGARRQNGTPP